MKNIKNVPNYAKLIEATFSAMKQLGGSGRNVEINEKVYAILNVEDDVLEILHTGNPNMSEIDYRLAWARTLLKNYGAVKNSGRSVWALTPEFANIEKVDGSLVERFRNISPKNKEKNESSIENNEEINIPSETKTWRQRVYEILLKMNPYAFERLAQRLLRECGFTDVTVTKSSGDGGIDGYGKLKINSIISFNIAFQCKRYQGSVGAPEIRDFRGSLTKNIEKGIFITTGIFSKAAKEEAENLGKQQIDLIDGESFIDMLANYELGLKEVKDYEIDAEFFAKI